MEFCVRSRDHFERKTVVATVAKNLIVELTDDVDGSVIDNGTGESIEFTVDGVDYAIDLKDENAKEFRKTIGFYVEHATRIGGRKRRSTTTAAAPAAAATPTATKSAPGGREQTRAIREWANANGYPVSDRGRIPAAIVEAFDAAH